jgi:hypothetical protein
VKGGSVKKRLVATVPEDHDAKKEEFREALKTSG